MNYFSCSKCGKAIAPHKSNLIRHESKCKGIVDKRCIACPECKQVFSRNELLRTHVEEHHHVNLEKEELFFIVYSDFLKWKEKIEKDNLCFYAVRTGTNASSNEARKYLYCHRSGHFISESLGFRKIKSQESNKIDSTCTSTMIVTEVNGGARVVFYKTHFGHGSNLGRCHPTIDKRTILGEPAENAESSERTAIVKDDSEKITEEEERNSIIQKLNDAIGLTSANNFSQEDYIIIHKKLDSVLDVLRGSKKRKMKNVTNLEPPIKEIEKPLKLHSKKNRHSSSSNTSACSSQNER